MYSTNICVNAPCGEGKVELSKPVDNFDKDRKDIRILIWRNHCRLIKNVENLLDRPNKMDHKFYYCERCTYSFNSQIKNDKHVCSHSFKSEIVCPKKKHVTFINEHKRQNIKKYYNC